LQEVRELEDGIIVKLLAISQSFCRQNEGDPSVVSLRDVKRSLNFMNFFLNVKTQVSERTLALQSIVLGLAFVYYYRQSKEELRFMIDLATMKIHFHFNTFKFHFNTFKFHFNTFKFHFNTFKFHIHIHI
jgi:uncharacterized membrane protein